MPYSYRGVIDLPFSILGSMAWFDTSVTPILC